MRESTEGKVQRHLLYLYISIDINIHHYDPSIFVTPLMPGTKKFAKFFLIPVIINSLFVRW